MRSLFHDKQFMLLAQNIDVAKAAEEIRAHDYMFSYQSFRQNFSKSPFKDTEFISCRMSYDFETEPTEEELIDYLTTKGITNINAIDTKEYLELPEVYRHVMTLAAIVKAEQIGRILVTKLYPGGHIKAHKDFGLYHDFYDRFHIVLSGKGCHFRCADKFAEMKPGEIWWFNNINEHEVWNNSDVDRIHIVIDFKLKGDRV